MKSKKVVSIMIIFFCSIILCSCVKNTDNREKKGNIFRGKGQLHNAKCIYKDGTLYDDEYTYYLYSVSMNTIKEHYVKIDQDNNAYLDCNLASCTHTDESCHAIADAIYFCFNGKLYKYRDNIVLSAETEKMVYHNTIPDMVKEETDSPDIQKLYVIDEEHLLIVGSSLAYAKLLDKDFNVLYTYTDPGQYKLWGKLYDGRFYYVNFVGSLMEVELDTGTSREVDLGLGMTKIMMPDDDGEYIFLSTTHTFYKYSLKTQECNEINEQLNWWEFMVYDGYIYNEVFNNDNSTVKVQIWDYDGNLVFETKEAKHMYIDRAHIANGKLYYIYSNQESDEKGEFVLAIMNLDGTGYTETKVLK